MAEFQGYHEEALREAETPEEIEYAKNYAVNTDDFERTPNGNFSQYEPATTSFSIENLEPRPRQICEALRTIGIVTLGVRYDGGHDEGFAHFDTAQSQKQMFSLQALIEAVKHGPLGEAAENLYVWNESGTEATRAQWAQSAIWELCEALAGQLLGDGYGTGEYSLYGYFTANLTTGEIIDQPTKADDLPADADEKYDAEGDENYDGE